MCQLNNISISIQALKQAGISDPSRCYFVDDSRLNIVSAKRLGWGHCVHFHEVGLETVEGGKAKTLTRDTYTTDPEGVTEISDLEELRTVWPEIFIQ